MSYTKATDFLAKDSLLPGNPLKIVKGSEIDTEFEAIETADALNVKTTALGTNVATALGVNVGTAGAFVVNGGVLGTPSSGTLTNCTIPQAGVTGLTTADSPQFTAVNIGHASDTTVTRVSAGVIAVEGSNVVLASGIGVSVQAYDAQLSSLIRQNSQSAAYTTVLTDSGKHILHPTADNNPRTFTIDSNANVAYPIGTAITFVNQINTLTIAITADTMTLAGVGTTGSRTLAANGMATALKISTTGWIISGTGLT